MCSILLPIKPNYVEQILLGKKKFEYRKKLCKKEIKKIYIYATSPVKKVVAEVEVISKIREEKDKLWNRTQQQSGITYELYCKYFSNVKIACAYQLGEVNIYNKAKELVDFGIDFYPQSYVYL